MADRSLQSSAFRKKMVLVRLVKTMRFCPYSDLYGLTKMRLQTRCILSFISVAHATCFIPIKPPVLNVVSANKKHAFKLCMSTQPVATSRADPGDTANDVKGSTILLIRHGETEWNSLGKWQGQQDSPLTNQGISQAAALGQRLKLSFQQVDRVGDLTAIFVSYSDLF
jgi:hypothetical protein